MSRERRTDDVRNNAVRPPAPPVITSTALSNINIYKLNTYNIIPTRGCGGGTLSYCHNLHVPDWPQRRRPTGERVCTVCGCMEPRVDYAVQHLSLRDGT